MTSVNYIHCGMCGYEGNNENVVYMRTVANGDVYQCPECKQETMNVEVKDDENSAESALVVGKHNSEEKEVMSLKSDLIFQLGTIDNMDWDYFLETALKAKLIADKNTINMPVCTRTIEQIVASAISATD